MSFPIVSSLTRLVRLLPPENLEDWLEEKRTAKDLLQDGSEQFFGFFKEKDVHFANKKGGIIGYIYTYIILCMYTYIYVYIYMYSIYRGGYNVLKTLFDCVTDV